MAEISRMIGLTPVNIKQNEEEISFEFDNGSKAVFYHSQDCCETVVVDDVNGDWDDLIGTPLLVADERISEYFDGEPKSGFHDDSETWTFYTFRSIRGSIDVRWHGASNGYYSESVDFTFIEACMNLDPKALEAAIDAFNKRHHILAPSSKANLEAAIQAYCEAAGVVMVPVDTVKIIGNHWAGEYFKGVISNDAEDIDRRISEMIRASQEEG